MRTAKTVNGVTHSYIYASGKLMRETYGTNTLDFFYDASGVPYAIKYNSDVYYYITNLQGDILHIVDGDGDAVVSYEYGPYGQLIRTTGDMADSLGAANPLRYRGYYYDAELGMYYLQSRYYDPTVGRFINADGAISGVGGDILGYNQFAYCFNNPVNMNDSCGNWPKWIESVVTWVNNNIVQPINNFLSSFSSSVADDANSLPPKGEPGSNQTLPNPDGTPKQKRWYGPDGLPERDRDYNHGGSKLPFPHDHEWKGGKRIPDHLPPSPEYEFSSNILLGAGLITICAIGMIAIATDDATGIGVVDDFLFAPLGEGIREGLILIFG